MAKKLIPLTDEIKNSSLFDVKTWEAPSEENSDEKIETVKSIVSKINLRSQSSANVFATKLQANDSKDIPKKCNKTGAIQKKIANEAEKNYLSRCLDEKLFPDEKLANRIEYNDAKNISIETLKASDEKNKPQSASNSPSLVLPNVPTRKMLNLLKPKFSIKTKEKAESFKQKLRFDPREAQKNLRGKLKIFKHGEKLFVKSDQTNDENVASSGKEIALCRPHIHIKDPNFAILTLKQKKLPKFEDLSLGDPYGIQLGLRNLKNKKTIDIKDLHASDVLLVAHAMACIKHPANWNEKDIDLVLSMGAELYRNTKSSHIDRSNKFTKGFTYREKFIQVTCSEPIVVGKIMTESERSMDLYNGLHKFFASYQHGLITIPRLELYVMMEGNALFVFDPRGRNEKCERDNSREAALMALTSIDNLYHLIMNLSNQSVHNLFFKICEIKITRMSLKINETEEFSAQAGNPNLKCRNSDFVTVDEHVIHLKGSVHLNSNIFKTLKNRHGLLSSIMAMVYSKIDPPASWNQQVFDRVMHFGYKLHLECLEGLAVIRNLSVAEVPSKFYVGDSYLTQICIVPYIQRCNVVKTRIMFDNPIVEAIMSAFESFKFLILELDNFYFALWKTEDEKEFYFFDGYQKTFEGYVDLYLGFSSLFISNLIDSIIEIVVNRMIRTSESSLKIHGLKVLTLKKLSDQEIKSKKIFKLAKMDCIRPLTSDDAKNLSEAPSTVDSVVPLFTKSEFKILSEKAPKKPKHLQMTDLNSPSLVACKKLAYHEIMTSIERKLSTINVPQVRDETMELMHEVQSEILGKIFGGKKEMNVRKCESVKALIKDPQTDQWCPCGEVVGTAEKVLFQTDLDELTEEREKLLTSQIEIDDEDEMHKCCQLHKQNPENLEFQHFQRLLDGTRIVSGTKNLFNIPLDPKIYDYENFSILIAVSAIVTSTRYKISTWSPETVDYVLGCGNIMSNVIELKRRMDFYTHDEHILPKIHLNQKFYNLGMKAVVSGPFVSLEKCLKKLFNGLDRFIIVTSRGSVAVFKRNDVFYLFEYATCNRVGYRIKDKDFGFSCMLSFTDLHSLVRRIYANHCDVKESDKFIVYRVILSELSDESKDKAKYVPFTPSKENLVIDNLRHHHKMKRAELLKMLNENDAKILEEKERIKNYRAETGQNVPENLTEDDLKHEKFDESKIDEAFELELNTDTLDSQIQPIYQSWCSLDELGFKQEKDDKQPKIKGSFGYENRMTIEESFVKKCHFASIFAILYAVHHPFESMNYRSVDVILENGIKLFESVDMKEYSKEMNLKNVIVDKRCYELLMSEFENVRKSQSPKDLFNNFFLHQKYGILQGANCAMALVKNKSSKSFQLFDPYNPTDTKIGDKNPNPIASWTNFNDIDAVIEYIKDKFVDEPYKLYQMGILSSKLLKSLNTGYFIFNPPKSSVEISCEYSYENADEKIEWIIDTRTIPWSRLEKTGVGNKWKEYEIEIERKLFSLFGNIHPNMKYFKELAGKQHLACCIVALVTSQLFLIDEWSPQILDNIVMCGTNFLKDVIKDKGVTRDELLIDDFSGVCKIDNFSYKINLQLEVFGQIYEEDRSQFNLCRALDYAFNEKKFNGVILLCGNRILSIGNHQNKTFFMYDCQSHGMPLFKPFQGTTYVLKCCCMKILLACIVLTLDIKRHGVKFHLYSVHGQETKAKKAVVIDESKK